MTRRSVRSEDAFQDGADRTAGSSLREKGGEPAELQDGHEQIHADRTARPQLGVAIAAVIGIFLLLQTAFDSWRLASLSFMTLPAASWLSDMSRIAALRTPVIPVSAGGGFIFSDYGDGAAIGASETAKRTMYQAFSEVSCDLYGAPLPALNN